MKVTDDRCLHILPKTPLKQPHFSPFSDDEEEVEQAGFIEIRLLQKGERMDALVEAFKP
jgi:hypothetical protein